MICLSCLGLRKILNRSLFLNLVLGHIAERNCQPKQQYLQKIKEFLQCVKKLFIIITLYPGSILLNSMRAVKLSTTVAKFGLPLRHFFLRNRQEHHTIAEE